jgi:hypothetical protein
MGGIKKDYKTGVIYGLYDPRDDSLRYIGQTVLPLETRLYGHLAEARHPFFPKQIWTRELLEMGMRPIIRVIATVPLSELDRLEKQFMRYYADAGCDLFNHQKLRVGNRKETPEYREAHNRYMASQICEPGKERDFQYEERKAFRQLIKRSEVGRQRNQTNTQPAHSPNQPIGGLSDV